MHRIPPTIAAALLTVAIGAGTIEATRTINRALSWHACLTEQQHAKLHKQSHAICRQRMQQI